MAVLDSSNWLKKTPNWFWWSFFPTFGGLAIAYAGRKSNTPAWTWLGIGIAGVALVLTSSELGLLVWLFQIGTAFSIKKPFLIKTYPKRLPLPEDTETANLIAETRPKIEINSCSKDELVYGLELPIVYANNIESLRNEGYIFTYLEELSEIASIPESYLSRIAPLVIFSYDFKKETDFSWRRLNTLSQPELVACGLDSAVAQKIIEERKRRGAYSSLMDVRRRTGLPLSSYRHLI